MVPPLYDFFCALTQRFRWLFYYTYAFLQKKRPVTFLLILLFTVLGISSKTNVWITAAAIFLALLIQAWMEMQNRLRMLRMACLFGLLTMLLSILNPLNQYISNYREYGLPILLNIDRQPFPHFLVQTTAYRPGILYSADIITMILLLYSRRNGM